MRGIEENTDSILSFVVKRSRIKVAGVGVGLSQSLSSEFAHVCISLSGGGCFPLSLAPSPARSSRIASPALLPGCYYHADKAGKTKVP